MSIEISPAFLVDAATGQQVPAELWHGISSQQLDDWEDHWAPELLAASRRLRASGVDPTRLPQSRHWNWRTKASSFAGSLANPAFSVMCDGMTQGMMIVNTLPKARAAGAQGKHLVYVEFLESAPWNQHGLTDGRPRYSGVGTLLMRAAIECSLAEDFKGRIGLHSLPQSNDWYGRICGMTDFGADPDPAHQNLHYYEMTQEQALAFIAKGVTK